MSAGAIALVLASAALHAYWNTFVAGSALLHLGYFVLLAAAYARADLTFVYPIAPSPPASASRRAGSPER